MSFSGRVNRESHMGGLLVDFEGRTPRLGARIRVSGGKILGRVDTVIGPVGSALIHVHPLYDGIDAKASVGSPVEIAPRDRTSKRRPRGGQSGGGFRERGASRSSGGYRANKGGGHRGNKGGGSRGRGPGGQGGRSFRDNKGGGHRGNKGGGSRGRGPGGQGGRSFRDNKGGGHRGNKGGGSRGRGSNKSGRKAGNSGHRRDSGKGGRGNRRR